MENKTIISYLERLPEPYRSQALENYDAKYYEDNGGGIEIESGDTAIGYAFSWYNSNQGVLFWSNLQDKVSNGTIQLTAPKDQPDEKGEGGGVKFFSSEEITLTFCKARDIINKYESLGNLEKLKDDAEERSKTWCSAFKASEEAFSELSKEHNKLKEHCETIEKEMDRQETRLKNEMFNLIITNETLEKEITIWKQEHSEIVDCAGDKISTLEKQVGELMQFVKVVADRSESPYAIYTIANELLQSTNQK